MSKTLFWILCKYLTDDSIIVDEVLYSSRIGKMEISFRDPGMNSFRRIFDSEGKFKELEV